ncbi:MAG: toprim domain-containing protein [Acidobacteria bacterium]|nr:toprim domain-containing protein [Acidobacteriota bacterium]
MAEVENLLECARAYHANLPERIREYLNARGIPDPIIDTHLLGWSGWRITIPICDHAGDVVFFKLAKDPDDTSDISKMYTTPGASTELYGWDRLLAVPDQIIICEGEFDRLVLEAHDFPAVTSTGGAGTFKQDWVEEFQHIPNVYVCFDNDDAGRFGAEKVGRLIPHAHIVRLPEEVGNGGDVTDFFVRLGKSREEFIRLLDDARPLPEPERRESKDTELSRGQDPNRKDLDWLKSSIALEDVVTKYAPLRKRGKNYAAQCIFHEDRTPSLVVFPQTQTFYCFGCQASGDVFSFLMKVEHLSFPEALTVLRELTPQNEQSA